jgi:MFS family permease
VAKLKSNNLKQTFRTFKYKNYRLYFGGQSISLIGTWIQIIAIGWLVYRLTNSAFILGLVGFFSRIPSLLLAPFAGVIADRWNRYKLLIWVQILAMIQAAILAALVFTNSIQVWQIIVLGIFGGVINSFDMPIRQAFVIDIVENREHLNNAIALNSILMNGARLVGPTIAGILVASVGEGWCFMINAISFIAIIGSLLFMTNIPLKTNLKESKPFEEFKEGFKYAFGFMPIRTIIIMLALVSLMGMSYQVLMPVYVKDVLKQGAHSLGFLMSAAGVGALIGGFYLASKKSVLGLGKLIVIASSIFGISLILFAFSKSFWVSMIILVFLGFGMISQMISSNTLLQTITDDDKRGRVMSFYAMAFMGTVPFGNLLAGSVANYLGLTTALFIGGFSCIIGAIWFWIKLPQFRSYTRPILIEKGIINQ